uniref:Uncharacterized protein n=1 Tax=Arundo donax TaxID=35708 RepID=A0A0A9FHU4_ARUDO
MRQMYLKARNGAARYSIVSQQQQECCNKILNRKSIIARNGS